MQPLFFSLTQTFNGVQTVNVDLPKEFGVLPLRSNILAAATELDGTGAPFIGGAAIQVLDIAPFQDAVKVRVNVLFNSPVTFRLSLVIWP
ncbi:MAG: hypothetical protein P4L56_20440 [Candidatus Sulfopaludibacter sp.]|nr:hypothetical protein [Candidatus Sulfopaludibacter sp.]